MSRSKELLIDIGVTIVVFMLATLLLGTTNYRNNQQDLGVTYRELPADISLHGADHQGSVLVLNNANDATATFPEFDSPVDWSREIVFAYIEYPQPTTGYRLTATGVERQGPVVTIDYQLLLPLPETVNLTVLTQPVLFVALDRTSLTTDGQLTVRFHNEFTNQTTSLSLSPNEIV